jgi:hypothetical protein
MRATLLDSAIDDSAEEEKRSRLRMLAGVLCALLVTGSVFAGYAYLRKRHAQQTLSAAQAAAGSSATQAKGPTKAEIYVDEALLKGDQTIIGGTVRNISGENLTELSVDLELRRRKDGAAQKQSVPVEPSQLGPQQQGRYSLQLRSADYSSVRLLALKGGTESSLLSYSSQPGQKRPPEKLETKTIIVNRPAPSKDGFLNTPDNPGRVP